MRGFETTLERLDTRSSSPSDVWRSPEWDHDREDRVLLGSRFSPWSSSARDRTRLNSWGRGGIEIFFLPIARARGYQRFADLESAHATYAAIRPA
jgi:hypothetical protein